VAAGIDLGDAQELCPGDDLLARGQHVAPRIGQVRGDRLLVGHFQDLHLERIAIGPFDDGLP
jgi:hypothetical protein